MTVQYYGVPKKDPRDLAAPVKYYPTTRCSGRADTRYIATVVSQFSTVSTTDMVAAMEAQLAVIPKLLADGYLIDLGDFGTYRLVLRGSAAATAKEITAQNILKARVVFKPGKLFKQVLKGLDFEKHSPKNGSSA